MNLTGQPVTPKPAKKPKSSRKGLRPRSAKKAAHMAAEQAAGSLEHMRRVKCLPCIVCGKPGPSEAHHLPDPRSDFRTIPLCAFHHRREYGPQAYHYSRRNFNAAHGSDETLLERTRALLTKYFADV